MPEGIDIFICYAHPDAELKAELLAQLAGMERRGVVRAWHDGRIEPGTPWRDSIASALTRCQMALLLVSADFLASEFIHSVELKQLLARHAEAGLRVVPIILRDCAWEQEAIGSLQALPSERGRVRPVIESLPDTGARDRAWASIARQVEAWAKAAAAGPGREESSRSASVPIARPAVRLFSHHWRVALLVLLLASAVYGGVRWWHGRQADADTHVQRAERLLDLDRYEPAEQEYRKALERDAHHQRARLGIDKTRVFEPVNGEFNAGEVRRRLDELLKAHPQDPHLHQFLGHLYVGSEPREAVKWYDAAIKLRPDLPGAWNGLGEAQEKLGHPTDAMRAYEEAVRLAPDEPRYRLNLATAYGVSGQPGRAIDILRTLKAQDTEYLLASLELVKALWQVGEWGQAKEESEQLITRMTTPRVWTHSRNQAPWYVSAEDQTLQLTEPEDKRYYGLLLASAAQFLAGEDAAVAAQVTEAEQIRSPIAPDIRKLVASDLRRLLHSTSATSTQPNLSQRVLTYQQRHLKISRRAPAMKDMFPVLS